MEKLAAKIAGALGLSAATTKLVERAAHLCKFDLVSLMVGEFPELQGDMGRVYALNAGEPKEVANAVRDHYRPIGAEGPVADDDVSACVALADRLDTLVGCFAVGLSPTGAADPFALRRACIATLRTLLDRAKVNGAYAKLVARRAVRLGVRRARGQEARPVARGHDREAPRVHVRAPPRAPRVGDLEPRRRRRRARAACSIIPCTRSRVPRRCTAPSPRARRGSRRRAPSRSGSPASRRRASRSCTPRTSSRRTTTP